MITSAAARLHPLGHLLQQRGALRDVAGEQLVHHVAHGDQVERALGQRPLRAPLARAQRLAGLRRQRLRQLQRRACCGPPRSPPRAPASSAAKASGPGPAPRSSTDARPLRQLGQRRARLRVAHRPVEEQVRAQQPRVVHVPRAGELPLARQAERQLRTPAPTSFSSSG